MDDIDQFFQDSHYNVIRVLLSISGLWPFHPRNRRYAIYLAAVLILGSGFIFEVKELFIKMQECCLSPKLDEEAKIQNSYTQYGRKLGYAYTGFILSLSVLYILSTLLTRFFFYTKSEKTDEISSTIGLLHRVNYMVDLDTYYIPIFIHSAICDFSFTYLLVIFDVLYLTLVEHCCGLFAALRYRLETALVYENDRLTTTKDKSYANNSACNIRRHTETMQCYSESAFESESENNNMQNKYYSNIVYSVRKHAEAIQFAAAIESLYRLPFFLQMVINVSVISIVGFQVVTSMEQSLSRLMPYGSYLSGLVVNIFLENWQGQKIMDCSEKVFESAYKLEWYKMPVMSQKLLIMIMIRSKKPLTITAGKILILSYVTFNTVMRTGFSYFMILRSVQ
ncbi:PREDICTED: odorant receptor Or2-like isoform X2 [Vollenhovia emeryi]|uniref:odorant receptor Or2-like isoform X2 n=1 Tax=Vollenhovia emeryi TaxID=411798 RepID=UPI0005F5511F|nr:PREDICTED: odorant receptor Or2-like isoform X2 [Vollenhovia emeryi]